MNLLLMKLERVAASERHVTQVAGVGTNTSVLTLMATTIAGTRERLGAESTRVLLTWLEAVGRWGRAQGIVSIKAVEMTGRMHHVAGLNACEHGLHNSRLHLLNLESAKGIARGCGVAHIRHAKVR